MLPVAVEPLLLEELPPLEELPLPEEPLLPEESPPPVELLLPAPAELLPLPEEAIPPLPAPAEAPLFPEAAPGVPELCAPVPAVGFASVAPPTGAAVDGVLTPPAPLVFDPDCWTLPAVAEFPWAAASISLWGSRLPQAPSATTITRLVASAANRGGNDPLRITVICARCRDVPRRQ